MKDIKASIKEFFNKDLGTVLEISQLTRPNFERLKPIGDGNLNCYSVHVMLDNLCIFGEQGLFLDNVFPRYQYLCNELSTYLNTNGFSVNNPKSTISVSIIPYPNPNGHKGKALPIYEHYSRGQNILTIEELGKYSTYYKELGEDYKIKYGVMTTNETVIGPDGGLIASACAVADTFDYPISVLELGTGSGTTPYALMLRNQIKSYDGNDFSPEMSKFFETEIQPKLTESNVTSTLIEGSCFDYDISTNVDLFSLGVYYEGQPDMFATKGEDISNCLNNGGVLIIQSGMLENTFINQLLFNIRTTNVYWPWYNKHYCVKNHFKYVSQQVVEDEIIIMASNNYEKFLQVLKRMSNTFDIKDIDIVTE